MLLPSAGKPVPTPLSIETLSAPVVVQLKLAKPPAVIEVGVAEKLSTLGAAGVPTLTVAVTVDVAVPPGPVAVRV